MKIRLAALFVIMAGVAFMGCGVALASVANTDHDMYYKGKGGDPNVCSYCHIPHKAIGDKIWSTFRVTTMPTGYSPIGNLCYTCHDNTFTTVGADVFNTSLQQHKVTAGKDCDMCHTVHDNTNGEFLGVVATQGPKSEKATYCETCHGSTLYPGAEPLGDHTAGSEHPYKDDGGTVLDESCDTCHKVHGAAQYTAGSLTHPILRTANTDSAYCAACHADHVQSTAGASKHPANITTATGSWQKAQCETCHDPHQPSDAGHAAILKGANVDSGYCVTCHGASDTSNGPGIGAHTHPIGVPFDEIPTDPTKTPAGNAIDDNAAGGADYPTNTAVIVCESCHSPHLKGVAAPALRITKAAGALCKNCHSTK